MPHIFAAFHAPARSLVEDRPVTLPETYMDRRTFLAFTPSFAGLRLARPMEGVRWPIHRGEEVQILVVALPGSFNAAREALDCGMVNRFMPDGVTARLRVWLPRDSIPPEPEMIAFNDGRGLAVADHHVIVVEWPGDPWASQLADSLRSPCRSFTRITAKTSEGAPESVQIVGVQRGSWTEVTVPALWTAELWRRAAAGPFEEDGSRPLIDIDGSPLPVFDMLRREQRNLSHVTALGMLSAAVNPESTAPACRPLARLVCQYGPSGLEETSIEAI
jgi:hypothetical protein